MVSVTKTGKISTPCFGHSRPTFVSFIYWGSMCKTLKKGSVAKKMKFDNNCPSNSSIAFDKAIEARKRYLVNIITEIKV